MQTLFEWDFNRLSREAVALVLKRNVEEFAPGTTDNTFPAKLTAGVMEKKDTLDEIITKAAPEWPLEKIACVDRNILRLGLFELLFVDRKEVPAKVAINEAIELAKSFGSESSGKFVNGVLGTVYKELGEPGKDEKTDKDKHRRAGKNNVKDFTNEELSGMPLQELAGGVVYCIDHGNVYLAMVHDIFGYWTLSKGKLAQDMGETIENAAKRKIKEELGVFAEVEERLGDNEYVANDPETGQLRKRVVYFLLKLPKKVPLEANSNGLDDSRWFPLEELGELSMYDDLVPIITKAVELLSRKINNHTV